MASSAAEVMFDVGALTTMTPAWVAAGTSTLSRPTPARAMTLSFFPAAIASASIWVADRMSTASTSASAGQQRAAVGSVEVADLEVGAEGVDRRGRELLGDQDDGLGHVRVLSGGTSFGVRSEQSRCGAVGADRDVRPCPWDGRPGYGAEPRRTSPAGATERVDGHPRHDEQRDDDDDHADDRDRPNARRDEQAPHDDGTDGDRPGLPGRHRSSSHSRSVGVGASRGWKMPWQQPSSRRTVQ